MNVLVDGAALVALYHLLSNPHIQYRVGQFIQSLAAQLLTHVRVVYAPVMVG